MFYTCASANLQFFFGKWATPNFSQPPVAVRFRPSGVLALAFLVALATLAVAAYDGVGAVSDNERQVGRKWFNF